MAEELGGPHLVAAFLCEKVLREQDGVFSFIRVVIDRCSPEAVNCSHLGPNSYQFK